MSYEALSQIALRQTNTLFVDSAEADPVADTTGLAILAEYGYAVDLSDSVVGIGSTVERMFPALAETKGAEVGHAALFAGFPDNLPEHDDVRIRALCYFLEDVFQLDPILPGWWPRSSVPQDTEAQRMALDLQKALRPDSHTTWSQLAVAPIVELPYAVTFWVQGCLNNPKSLRDDQAADFKLALSFIDLGDLDFEDVPFRETKALISAFLFEQGSDAAQKALAQLNLSPTDILRMLAIRNGHTNASLVEPLGPVKLSRREARQVLYLANLSNYGSDFYRYRGLWLQLFRSLRLDEYRKDFPDLGMIADKLRANRRDHNSENSMVEAAIKTGDIDTILAVISHGNFMRRLVHLVSLHSKTTPHLAEQVIDHLGSVATEFKILDMFVLVAHLESIRPRTKKARTEFLVFNKKGSATLVEPRSDIRAGHLDKMIKILRGAIVTKLVKGDSGQLGFSSMFVDDQLDTIILPTQQRTASDGMIHFERGSRFVSSSVTDRLRLFVHWCETDGGNRSDLDLSVVTYDEKFKPLSQVSYTNLKSGNSVHSGDLTSAPYPNGSSEFIDVLLDSLPAETAYVGPSIYNYSGPAWSDLERAYCGWMWRVDASTEYKLFDPSTVENKINLTVGARTLLPFLLDVRDRSITVCDMAVHTEGWGQSVERTIAPMSTALSFLAGLVDTKPTVGKMLRDFAAANNLPVVDRRDDADVVFDLTNVDDAVAMIVA